MKLTEKQLERFWKKINRGGENDCWDWVAATTSRGYGEMGLNKKTYLAHRLSFEIHNNRDILPGMEILHSCNRRVCCNPKHLSEGTHLSNMQDMMAKGRATFRVLAEEDVRTIRHRYADRKRTGATQTSIAIDYGISPRSVGYIVTRQRWANVE